MAVHHSAEFRRARLLAEQLLLTSSVRLCHSHTLQERVQSLVHAQPDVPPLLPYIDGGSLHAASARLRDLLVEVCGQNAAQRRDVPERFEQLNRRDTCVTVGSTTIMMQDGIVLHAGYTPGVMCEQGHAPPWGPTLAVGLFLGGVQDSPLGGVFPAIRE